MNQKSFPLFYLRTFLDAWLRMISDGKTSKHFNYDDIVFGNVYIRLIIHFSTHKFMKEVLLWTACFPAIAYETAPWIDLSGNNTPLDDEFQYARLVENAWNSDRTMSADAWYRCRFINDENAVLQSQSQVCMCTNCCCFQKMNHLSIGRKYHKFT